MNDERKDNSRGKRKSGCVGCATVFGFLLFAVIILAGISQSYYGFVQEPMVDAARNGDIAQVNHLLRLGADVNGVADDEGTGTALIGAAAEGHADIVRLLIRRGADVNKAARYFGNDQTPLKVAAHHPESVALLKKAGAME